MQLSTELVSLIDHSLAMKEKIIISGTFAAGVLMLATTAFAQVATTTTSTSASDSASTGLHVMRQPDGTCTLGVSGSLVPCTADATATEVKPATTITTVPNQTTTNSSTVVRHPDGTCTLGSSTTQVSCTSGSGPTTVVTPGTNTNVTPGSGTVLGTSTTPGLPNTGAGGDAALNLALLSASGAILAGGAYLLSRRGAF